MNRASRAETAATIRADFDRIALLPSDDWNHNTHYHDFLLRHLPARCDKALDIGCGTGTFARLLARRSGHVLALDLSPQMIRLAQERSRAYANIDYRVADATQWALPAQHFDCIVSIATLHHMPLEDTLGKLKNALAPGGVLAILDLYESRGLIDALTSAVAVVLHLALRWINTRRLRAPRAVREAWAAHGQHDAYPTLARLHQACDNALPGSQVKKHLLWRYSIIWKKGKNART
jgi:SAM-dependent methyltransferase